MIDQSEKKKTRAFGMRVDAQILDEIDEEANRLGVSRNQYLVDLWINRYSQEEKLSTLSLFREIRSLREETHTLGNRLEKIETSIKLAFSKPRLWVWLGWFKS